VGRGEGLYLRHKVDAFRVGTSCSSPQLTVANH
jgi:hypothetical protein